jgi:hypothetical protein
VEIIVARACQRACSSCGEESRTHDQFGKFKASPCGCPLKRSATHLPGALANKRVTRGARGPLIQARQASAFTARGDVSCGS